MARQVGMEITGTIGNVIFYKRQGEFLMRTVQEQAEASKRAAEIFGQAASKAKLLRQLLLPLLPNPKDREMQNRLTPAMREFLSESSNNTSINPFDNPLAGFRFVRTSDLKHCLHFPIGITQQADGNIRVEIPAINPEQSIVAPGGTGHLELQVMAAAFGRKNDRCYAGQPQAFHIPYENQVQPAVSKVLTMQADAESIIIIVAALCYWNNEKLISEEGFMPVEVVGVFRST